MPLTLAFGGNRLCYSDECETDNAKQSIYDLSDDSAKELAVAEKHESGDRPNNQRALMSDTMGTRYASAIALKIAT